MAAVVPPFSDLNPPLIFLMIMGPRSACSAGLLVGSMCGCSMQVNQ